MDFLINRTNILDAIRNENPKIMEDLGDLGRLLVNLVRACGVDPTNHYITQLNNEIMFDDIFKKVIGNSADFLMKCLTGESGRGQHMCKENELIFAHITYADFPEAYEGVEGEYLRDFGDNLLRNGFKEITDDLKQISKELDFDIKNTRSFIYTVNKFGREFAPMFDQIIQYNIEQIAEEDRMEAEEKNALRTVSGRLGYTIAYFFFKTTGKWTKRKRMRKKSKKNITRVEKMPEACYIRWITPYTKRTKPTSRTPLRGTAGVPQRSSGNKVKP